MCVRAKRAYAHVLRVSDYALTDCEVRILMADNSVVIGERKRNRSINDHNDRLVMVGF